MKPDLRIVLVAVLAAVVGAGASVFFEPTIATRLASTEPGQRMLGAALAARAPPPPKGTSVARRGDIVPALRLLDLDGTPVEIPRAWAGRPTLVNFWATWCAPCLKEMPELQAFASDQGAQGVRVVGIALDEPGAVRAFLQQRGISYAILLDAPGAADAGVRWGNPAGVLPYSVLLSAQGRLLKSKIGPFEDARAIQAWVDP